MLRSGVKLMAGVALLVTAVTPVWSSSHREAPNITEKPKVDNTDVYAFRSYEPGRAGFVTLITHFQPFQEPGGGPNYFTMDEDALYEIMVDSNGDAVEDITFQFDFNNLLRGGVGRTIVAGGKNLPVAIRFDGPVTEVNDLNLGEFETYTVTQVRGDRRTGTRSRVTSTAGTLFKPLDNVGNKTIPNYATYSDKFIYDVSIPGCSGGGRVFAGQREENFAVNLGPIFDLVNFIPIQGDNDPVFGNGQPFPGGITQSILNSELVENPGDQPRGYGYNVTSLAIEVPISCLTGNGNGVIGVWSTASMPQSQILNPNPTFEEPETFGGAFVQVSRLGNPLVNELVIGLPQKDLFNAVEPTADAALADFVTNPTFPEILNVLFLGPVNATLGTNFRNLAPRNFPRADLVATFLTGIPTLNQLATVTPSEMQRLNTAVNPTPIGAQHPLGVVADDLAGFPNGRRPGDDVVDIELRVLMGRLCHPIPINGVPTQLGLCRPSDAPTGLVAYTDGAPSNANTTMNRFPYFNPALRGAPRPQDRP